MLEDTEDAPLDLQLLGPPALCRGGRPLELPTQKALAVACVLAARRGPVSRAELAELLWGPGRTRNVRQALYTLRRLPGVAGRLGDGDPVTLDADSDLARFEAALDAGDAAAALDAWRGTFLDAFEVRGAPAFQEWVSEMRTRLEARHHEAVRRRLGELEAGGRAREARRLAAALLAADPLDEAAHRAAIRLAWIDGDREGALAAWETCRHVLARELGVAPDAETKALVQELLRTGDGEPAPRRIPLAVLRPPVLAGRDAERARLEAAWDARRPVLLVGPGGSGKSRLAEEVARSRGTVLRAGGRPGDAGVSYLGLARLLRRLLDQVPDLEIDPWMAPELARVVPDRVGVPPAERDDPASRARFVRAHTELLTRAGTAVDTVVVDDLHLLDAPSFELAHRFLSQGMGEAGPRLVVCTRDDGLEGAAREALAALVDEGAVERIDLAPLTPAGVAALVAGLGIPDLAPLAQELHRLTGGSPLEVVETLKDLFASGALDAQGTGDLGAEALRAQVPTASVARRLEALPPLAARVAQALALAEDPLGAEALARVVDADPFEVAGALDTLEAASVIEDGAFVHDLVREAVEARVAPGTARLLHGRLAAALEGVGASPATVAGHLLAAGDPAAAAPQLLAAGKEAAARFADDEARRLLHRALEAHDNPRLHLQVWLALEAVAARTGEGQAEALAALARLAETLQDDVALYESKRREAQHRVERGEPARAAGLAEAALDIARRLSDPVRAGHAQVVLGLARLRAGDLDGARGAFAKAADAPDDGIRIQGLNGVGAVDGIRGDLEPAFALHQEALTLARARGDVTAAGRLLNSLAATAERLAWYNRARDFFGEAMALARRTRDPRSEAIACLNAVEIDLRLGRFADGLAHLDTGEDLARGLSVPRLVALGAVRRGTLERAVGRPEAAVAHLEAARAAYLDAEDARNAAVLAFNVALARAEAGVSGALRSAVAAVGDIEAAGVQDIAAWAWLELALVTGDPGEARVFAARGPKAKDNPHVRLLAALARQRAALLEGRGTLEPDLAGLATRLPVWEAAWAEALLARASTGDAARRHARTARDQVAAQAEGLPEDLAAALQGRLSQWLADEAQAVDLAAVADV